MNTLDRRVRETFVELADTLVDDYDVIDFAEALTVRVVDLLGVSACGIVLADHRKTLNLVAASSEQTRLLELFQIQNAEGPCLDAFMTGEPVQVKDLAQEGSRWPAFAPAARATGYSSVYALPMRLRDTVIGALNLFGESEGSLIPETVNLAQAMADVATIGILHERTVRQQETVAEQLQSALNSRILIEQAKGVIAERRSISVTDAFEIIRNHARSQHLKLRDVAAEVVGGGLDIIA